MYVERNSAARKIALNPEGERRMLGALKSHYEKNPGFWSQVQENLVTKAKVAVKQPVEYSIFFTLTSIIPFIDETTAAALTNKFSRDVLHSSGFQAPHPETPEYKNLLKVVASAKTGQFQPFSRNALERNEFATALSQARRTSTPPIPVFEARRPTFNAAAVRVNQSLLGKLKHYQSLTARKPVKPVLPARRRLL